MRCPRRLTLHHDTQNAVDARLVALAMTLEPIEHVLIQTNGQLLFRRRPSHRRLLRKVLSSRECPTRQYRHPLYGQSRLRDANRTAAGTAALQDGFPRAAIAAIDFAVVKYFHLSDANINHKSVLHIALR